MMNCTETENAAPACSFDRAMYIARKIVKKGDALATFKRLLSTRTTDENVYQEVEVLGESLHAKYSRHNPRESEIFEILSTTRPEQEQLKKLAREMDDLSSDATTAAEMAGLALGVVIGLKFAGISNERIAEVWGILEAD